MLQDPKIAISRGSNTELKYSCTNESLSSIVEAMALEQHDVVLAIGGSGDQAFSMLEYAGKVYVVDQKVAQIDFINKRVEGLRDGNMRIFFQEDTFGTDDSYADSSSTLEVAIERKETARKYFRNTEGRIEKLRERLPNLCVLDPVNIFSVAASIPYSKLFLSNAFDDGGSYNDLKMLVSGLPPNGKLVVIGSTSRLWIQQFCGRGIPLELDKAHNDLASEPAWSVSVFKKVA